ncbi:MAG: class I SAM-dependent methyltransferase [Candidatus Methylacidiphilaceae bacterium]
MIRRRMEAAERSGGISAEPIYALIDKVIEARQLVGSVLDFGAGRGLYVERLVRSGRFDRVEAVDLLPKPEFLSDEILWRVGDLNCATDFPDGAFDLVLAAEVIEHLENPRAVAREWFRLLRPKGTLLVTTPNNESWRSLAALLVKGHFTFFLDESYPAHITALVRKDIERILSEAGFARPSFQYTNVGLLPVLHWSWQRILGPFANGLRFSDNVLAIAQKPDISLRQ